MDTKSRILAAALELYNEKGIDATTRHIAAAMDISPGNLHYHFKQTDDVIMALWDRLVAEFSVLVINLDKVKHIGLDTLRSFYRQSFDIEYKYRFIFLHFVAIGARLPKIREQYAGMMQRREKEFKGIFKKLVQGGIFQKDVPPKVWKALVRQIFIVADFWLSSNELTDQLRGEKAATAFTRQMEAMFYPYLSARHAAKITL
ncbi:TetR/AcrR family transcriptional regulator [Chitinophaga sedimenti]|uniref:TetR/AcrR family transcriptional regulator n=1 Tax=Chitinophaga sedimenti TaxID=2033606 RepID=UPI002002CCD1|nr:TetR/AcrR family transcriptional regulator [Chitinophaga sedimenti]MCK7554010.1 TetR/AcrR family transcriptional regulator [Chitinophaga sedimenti]